MKIIDLHCDALFRMQESRRNTLMEDLRFRDSNALNTNLQYLKKGRVKVQFFAIFIMPNVPVEEKWQRALEQIDLFYTEILLNPEIKHIKKWQDILQLNEGEIGVVLTLEGADAFGNDLAKLRMLYRLGVLLLGLTWNNANLCADGVGEIRGAGLTTFGKEVIALNNANHVLTDVSHLSVKAFWDTLELADYPIASHSNVFTLCPHPRNLHDEQIIAMIKRNAMIHVVFWPPFINHERAHATLDDLVRHIEYICELGGVKNIGFGSDFDGISSFVTDLEDASKYQNLISYLLKYYREDEVKGFAYQNFIHHLPRN
ncbi:dipeptidase [Ornithinibacillus bavariensis]|uniref:dipeptidase n=1 Tax=Ornithinibacillus bavariensis TaxID=545502 RepID=UPI000ED95063|nr:diguanylate cyclase [Ornithinibacillus sp.]